MTTTVQSTQNVPKDVLAFCSKSNLAPYLDLALQLARECFDPVRRLNLEIEFDPDTDEERVIVEVGIEMPVNEVLERNSEYTSQWVAQAPLEARQKIRLLYNIL